MSSILIKNASFNNVENCTEYSLLDNINKLVYNLKENKYIEEKDIVINELLSYSINLNK